MPTHSVETDAPAELLWALVARPDQWSRWSPHVRRAEGLGSPIVREGARGRIMLRGGLVLAASVTEVTAGRSWSWRVGGIDVSHTVAPTAGGSRLEMAVEATGAPWTPVAIAYGPLVGLIMRRLAAIAERDAGVS